MRNIPYLDNVLTAAALSPADIFRNTPGKRKRRQIVSTCKSEHTSNCGGVLSIASSICVSEKLQILNRKENFPVVAHLKHAVVAECLHTSGTDV